MFATPDLASLPLAAQGRDWLAFGVAVYGAIVASGVAIYQTVRDRPGVTLVMTPINVSYDDDTGTRDFWGIRIVNHRKRPITIRDAGLLGEDGKKVHAAILNLDGSPMRRPFPKTLTDGTSIEIYIPHNWRSHRQRSGAWAVDDLRRTYKVHEPSRNPRRRWRAWRVRRRFEKAITERRGSVLPIQGST